VAGDAAERLRPPLPGVEDGRRTAAGSSVNVASGSSWPPGGGWFPHLQALPHGAPA